MSGLGAGWFDGDVHGVERMAFENNLIVILMNSLFENFAWGWWANWWSLSGQNEPPPLVSNVRCAHFLNSLLFYRLDGKIWWDRCGLQAASRRSIWYQLTVNMKKCMNTHSTFSNWLKLYEWDEDKWFDNLQLVCFISGWENSWEQQCDNTKRGWKDRKEGGIPREGRCVFHLELHCPSVSLIY